MPIAPEFLTAASKRIRATLMELRPQLLQAHGAIEHELKDDASAVTEMDLLVEKRLHEALGELDPTIGLAGEETGADFDQETFWLVDPIDGTEPFIRGLPFSTNMIALIHHGEPIMSVIYNFFLDEYYHAVKGEGATMNGHPIHVSDRPMDRAYVVFGSKLKDPKLFGLTDRLRQRVLGLPQMAGAGYTYASIAAGQLDGLVAYNGRGKPWDHAPGTLLVREAGGRVENLFSPSYDYRNLELVAAAPSIFPELKQFFEDEISAVGK
ncbi:MAG TPA: inositol monophosphatase family protein [Candidatus Saccharimonadia bacterium]|nr:inositol monophosphatase family protein [Candidatus Saccharimonadia bacterium]